MKVMCNGFNLYNQLNNADPIIETLKLCFEGDEILNFCINHTFSILHTRDKCLQLFPNKDVVEFKVNIVKIVSSDEKIIALDDAGRLYKINVENPFKIKELPNFLMSEHSDEVVKDISIGCKITVAYTNRGSIYNVPNKLSYENANIIDIKCGKEHCLLLDQQGNIYSFGRGR